MKPRGACNIKILLILAVFCIANGCNTYHKDASPTQSQPAVLDIDRIKADLKQFDFSQDFDLTDSMSGYVDFYSLDIEDTLHYFGRFQSGSEIIAAHVFLPPDPGGTLFLIHGYLDHSATLKNLIRAGLEREFAVAVFDLPGHGLSTGERGYINDFSDYAASLNDFISNCKTELPRPFHLIAHSTGSSIAYEYLNHTQQVLFQSVVFLAPLVHHSYWRLSTFGWRLARPFVKTLPRKSRQNSSDPDFLAFVKKDPLQNKTLSIAFLAALSTWNKKIEGYHRLSRPVLIIQGEADTVVDWKYNIDFFKSKISPLEIRMVAKARHQLANESDALKLSIFNSVFEYIDRPERADRIRFQSPNQ